MYDLRVMHAEKPPEWDLGCLVCKAVSGKMAERSKALESGD